MMEEASAVLMILSLGGLGLAYGLYYIISVFSINPKEILKDDEEKSGLVTARKDGSETETLNKTQIQNLKNESNKILSGVNSFIFKEILYSALVLLIMTFIVKYVADKPKNFYRAIAFLTGAILNFLSCYITVIVASGSNYRIVYKSFFGLGEAYNIVFKASLVISFCVVSVCLLSIIGLILIYKSLLITPFSKINDYNDFFESIFAFGLGASIVSLISRIAGGFYSKTADIAGDIMAKNFKNIKNEDETNNPLSIYDKIGDILGGIAGVATDSFGTLSLGICSALYMASTSEELINTGGYYYPLLITASGILVCILSTSVILIFGVNINTKKSLFKLLILQMFFSIFLVIPLLFCISYNFVPEKYNVGRSGSITYKEGIDQSDTMMCPLLGLMSGLCISIISFYYTSDNNPPVSELLETNKQGSTIGIILGLSLGYISSLFPTIIIACSVFYSYYFLDIFGITLCALGMLITLPIYISIDASGTIADNSSGLAVLCGMSEIPTKNLKKIERVCNTLGKGYIMSCSCMVALSLLGVYVIISKLNDIDVNTPLIFAGLLFGAMKPYYLNAVILKELSKGSVKLLNEMKPQKEFLVTDTENINSSEKISTKCKEILLSNSVKKIFYPSALVVLLPIKIGLLLGNKAIAGMILGIIISGIQLGISSYISGIAWKSTKSSIDERGISVTIYEKKQIDLSQLQKTLGKNKDSSNQLKSQDEILTKQNEINDIENNKNHFDKTARIYVKDSDDKFYKKCFKSSIIGDIIGDALKDLSGPFLMVIIKLIPVICIVSSHYFLKTSYLIENL